MSQIDDEFNQIESYLFSVALTIEHGYDEDQVINTMNDIKRNNLIINKLYYGKSTDGSYIMTDEGYSEDIDVRTRPWYINAINEGGMSYSQAYIDLVTNKPNITIAYPIYNDSYDLLGVIGADLDILAITHFLNNFSEEGKTFAFLLDAGQDNGIYNVIGHPSLEDQNATLVDANTLGIPSDLLVRDIGLTDYVESNDQNGKIAYGYISNTPYMFGIFMSRAELNQSLRTFTIIAFFLLALMLLAISVTFYIYRQRIKKPMNRLIYDIEKIDISKNADFRLDISNQSSFKDARVALNGLIDMSVDYQKQLEESLDELSLENQKFELLLSSSSDIVFMIDQFKRYVNIFGQVKELLGVSKEEMIGKTHQEVYGFKFSEERNDQYSRALNGERVLYSWEVTKDGKTYYYENTLSPMYNHDHEIIGAVGVARDITEQESRYRQLVYISTHDHLTGLYNRKVYYEKLESLNQARAYPFAVLNLDFNGLKLINDAYGHDYGDVALKKTAEVLLSVAREEDIVSRVSGDEFTVVMPNASKKEVDRFKTDFNKLLKVTKVRNIALSVAVGFNIQKDSNVTLDEVRKLAENNMYKQKILDRKSVKNKAISAILKTLTDKFDYEKRHSSRVMKISKIIGQAMDLDDESLKALATAAMFHDIGKISLPDEILNKPGKLTDEEYEIIKTHTSVGYDILNTADEYSELAIHASSHHERYDGNGYPNGLKGQQIPLFSRIICIADAYEAMTSDRPYRKRLTDEHARQEIIDNAGTQFDPDIAKVFVEDVIDKGLL
jgi:diguanylate cyclase (GGDEF)-like protein/PAS domain S-box-containing protein